MTTPGFEAFWAAWPANRGQYARKGCKSECLKRWKARYHETQADQIVKHVEWLKTTADWLKDGGRYIPAPLVYINQQRWDGAEIPQSAVIEHESTEQYLKRIAQERAEQDAKVSGPSPEVKRKLAELGSGRLRRVA